MDVSVRPELLIWARERASLDQVELARMVGSKKKPAPIEEWEKSGTLPLKKLQLIAKRTHTPFGMLFLEQRPEETLPIEDFRGAVSGMGRRPSLNLLQTVYDAQFRQAWLSGHLQAEGHEALEYVGSATTQSDPAEIGAKIREQLGLQTDQRAANNKADDVVLWMLNKLDSAGIVAQRNGVVGNQTKRRLDPNEFKGFALADPWAPLVFINGNDWPASQIFTIAHECAHIWIGTSAVPDGDWYGESAIPVERFCNRVAAEVLMPAEEFEVAWRSSESAHANAILVSRAFAVSTLAALVRARYLGLITQSDFEQTREDSDRTFDESRVKPKKSGGNYYHTARVRLGNRLLREVLSSTLEGRTLYSEAFEILGTRKTSVFNGLVEKFLLEGEK